MYSKRAMSYAKIFVDEGIVDVSKLKLVAENIQRIMFDMQSRAIEDAAVICENAPGGNRETVARAIRGLKPPK